MTSPGPLCEPGGLGRLRDPTLFDALPRGFSDCSHRCGRVGVLQLVGGKCRDYSLLVTTDKIWENTALNVRDDRLVGFIDSVRAKTGDEP